MSRFGAHGAAHTISNSFPQLSVRIPCYTLYMNKQVLISLSIVIIGGAILLGLVYLNKEEELSNVCPLEVMACPDGSTVSMSGPNCEYGVCKQTAAVITSEVTSNEVETTAPVVTNAKTEPVLSFATTPETPKDAPSAFSAVIQSVVQLTGKITSSFRGESNSLSNPDNTQYNQSNNQREGVTTPTPQGPISTLNEERFTVNNGSIVDSSGNTVATIPVSISTEAGTTTWDTTIVNVIEVGSTTPVVDGVPVVGATGKYYVSENSFGSIANCEFSNKIFILDTIAETYTLLFEENSSTLSRDDPRACNSEIFLLATEDEKLILKYHTLDTNMTCESTWSEPDKTWYLDVTNLSTLMRRYQITSERYSQAESQEISCRAALGEGN